MSERWWPLQKFHGHNPLPSCDPFLSPPPPPTSSSIPKHRPSSIPTATSDQDQRPATSDQRPANSEQRTPGTAWQTSVQSSIESSQPDWLGARPIVAIHHRPSPHHLPDAKNILPAKSKFRYRWRSDGERNSSGGERHDPRNHGGFHCNDWSTPDPDEDEDEDEDQIPIHIDFHVHIHFPIQIEIQVQIQIQNGHCVVVIENSALHTKASNFVIHWIPGVPSGGANLLHRCIAPRSSLLAHHAGDSHRQRDTCPGRNAESKSNDGAGEEVQVPVLQSSVQPQRTSKSARKIA